MVLEIISKVTIILGSIMLAYDAIGIDRLDKLPTLLREFKERNKDKLLVIEMNYEDFKSRRNQYLRLLIYLASFIFFQLIIFYPTLFTGVSSLMGWILIVSTISLSVLNFKTSYKVGVSNDNFTAKQIILSILSAPITIPSFIIYIILKNIFSSIFYASRIIDAFLRRIIQIPIKRLLAFIGLSLIIIGTLLS